MTLRTLALLALVLEPCGGGGDLGSGGRDSVPVWPMDQGPGCDLAGFPCGPYGHSVGAAIPDLKLEALLDPDHLCEAHSRQQPDLTRPRSVSLSRWYQGDKKCPGKRRLLWIMTSAGWCAACRNEVTKAQQRYAAGELDPRVAVLDLVLETTTKGQAADTAFLKTWAKAYGLTFPVARPLSSVPAGLVNAADVPVDLLVDLRTMRLLFKQTGADWPTLQAAMKAGLK